MKKMSAARARNRRDFGKLLTWLLGGITLVTVGLLLSQRLVEAAEVVIYKSPTCGCCNAWVDHLRDNGFSVETHDRSDMHAIKTELGVPYTLQSCHTALVNGYVIEGHVPADDIKRLLQEKPDVEGLTAPGMPMGSPGMEGPRKDPYDVLTFQRGGKTSVYNSYNQ